MAPRLGLRSAGIGCFVLALASASWAGATPPDSTPPEPGAAASTVVNVPAARAPAPASVPTAGRKSTGKPASKLGWNELTAIQKEALLPLSKEWGQMDELRKKKWMEIANRYASMQPAEQKRVQERMYDWAKLTPEQRRVARENYARTSKIGPSEKSAQWEQYQQLPDEQKRLLAEAAAKRKRLANLPSKPQNKANTPPPIKSGLTSAASTPPASAPPATAPGSTPPVNAK